MLRDQAVGRVASNGVSSKSKSPADFKGEKMEQDLSYLRSEYAREKMIEEYNHDEPREAEDEQVPSESRQSDRVDGDKRC